MSQSNKLRMLLRQRVVFLDGGMGTELLRGGMPSGITTEEWAFANPSILESIHENYIAAGADIILTCTFGGTTPKLGSVSNVERYNSFLADTALRISSDRTLVGASIGPTGELIHPSGSLSWQDTYRIFKEQIEVLSGVGIDIFFLETFSDPRELKAAVLAVRDTNPDAFISAQMTFSKSGVSLAGTSPTALALLSEHLAVDCCGANCSSGPEELYPIAQQMIKSCAKPVVIEPNAGIPLNGKYPMNPQKFAKWMDNFAEAGVSIIGGCCGTGPEHVKRYRESIGNKSCVKANPDIIRALTSIDRIKPIGARMLTVGESINPTGKRHLQKIISTADFMGIVSLAKAQMRADVIDINFGLEKTIPVGFIREVFSRLSIGCPLSVDLSSKELIRAAFEESGGLNLLNSLTCRRKYIESRIDILLRHGGYTVLLPIDESGIGETPADRLNIIRKGVSILNEMGFPKHRIIADPIVKPIGTGAEVSVVIETLKLLRAENLLTIAGISNVSHGLPERSGLNAALLTSLANEGLDLAIFDVMDTDLVTSYRSTQVLLGNIDPVELPSPELKTYGPSPDFFKILQKNIVLGNHRGTDSATRELLESGVSPQKILTSGLSPAMQKVGELYSAKKLFLPHLIASAQAASAVTSTIEPLLKSKSGVLAKKGTVVIASVRGDIHDIGKNLVVLFLKNAGYDVIDLGKDVHAETIVDKAVDVSADVIALSALMSTTAAEMESVIALLRESGSKSKILVGGAVITPEYADAIGADAYAEDAYSAVLEVDRLI